MYRKNNGILTVFIFIFFAVLTAFILPLISFCTGWLIGLIIKLILGDFFVKGLSLINIFITAKDIPLLCGVIGLIGGVFKGLQVNIKTKGKSEY